MLKLKPLSKIDYPVVQLVYGGVHSTLAFYGVTMLPIDGELRSITPEQIPIILFQLVDRGYTLIPDVAKGDTHSLFAYSPDYYRFGGKR